MVQTFNLLFMVFQIGSRGFGILLFWLVALGYPGVPGAEPEGSSPPLQNSEPAVVGRTLETPEEPLSPWGPVQLDLGSHRQSSDGAEAESFSPGAPTFSPGAPTFPIRANAEVRHFLEQYQTGYRRAVVERWIERSGRYAEMIQGVFRNKGLPEDLMFTAMIESGFNPVAVSRAGAKGLWQFMAPTARRYGLRVDNWVDERLDPEKSTVAAARYLGDLYALFGSWELAKAGYNAGEMTVLRAMKALGTSNFWDLTRGRILREETKNFVPAIHAATLIGREPERYGFTPSKTEPLAYEAAPVPSGLALSRVAMLVGVGIDVLCALNPELKMKQTPPGGPYLLKFPVGVSERFIEAQERERGRRLVTVGRGRKVGKREIHVVQPKETVGAIARRYGVSAAELTRWNELNEAASIRPGDRLRIASAATTE